MVRLTATICLLALILSGKVATQELTDLSFEELMQIEVTSVSKKNERLSQAAAAVYVVTQNEISRSGAASIPEALKLVPGVHVAQIDPNKWAVGIRGFSGRLANKLLVLIDGRSVYTPTYSGVYWEQIDYPMADIERIEIIRGPGATLWGTNAVNGVINIITKDAADTLKGRSRVALGNEQRVLASIQQGATLNDETHARFYAKGKQLDGAKSQDGSNQQNDGGYLQAGFRADWQGVHDQWLTLQGDLFNHDLDQELGIPVYAAPFGFQNSQSSVDSHGGNLTSRWTQLTGLDSEVSVALWYDFYQRTGIRYSERLDAVDLSLQHQFLPTEHQELVWGGGYRWAKSQIGNGEWASVAERSKILDTWNLFAQDTIRVPEHALSLTLGTKIEGNSYSDVEIQPNVRLSWAPDEAFTVWGAVSRASRIPSRGENDSVLAMATFPADATYPLPQFMQVSGSDSFDAENLNAYELGLRWLPQDQLAMDLALFYNDYTNLRSYVLGTPTPTLINGTNFLVAPLTLANNIDGYSQGVELLATWHATEQSRYKLSYSYIDIHLDDSQPSLFSDIIVSLDEDRSPQHQISLWASYDLSPRWELDIRLFYKDEQAWEFSDQAGKVDAFTNADIRLGWLANDWLEIGLNGRNLLHDQTEEFTEETWSLTSELERHYFIDARIEW